MLREKAQAPISQEVEANLTTIKDLKKSGDIEEIAALRERNKFLKQSFKHIFNRSYASTRNGRLPMLQKGITTWEQPMAKIPSIDDLNTKQLRTLIETAHLRIKEIEEEELQATRAKLQELVEQSGFDIQRLFPNLQRPTGGRGRPRGNGGERTPAKPKYRSLRDPSLTWTGKGRMSSWLVAEMEETGKPREAFLIA